MNRHNFFIIIIIAFGGMSFQGTQLSKKVNQDVVNSSDSNYTKWVESLTELHGIPSPAFNLAINGYYELQSQGLIKNDSLLTIIDFSKPSIDKRFFILDLKNRKVLKNTLVAHGMNSGVQLAEAFSNNRHSNKSSLGLYITGETYEGDHGYSLRLDGMSQEINDNARKRAIVIHGADYVSNSFIERNGRIGRSFGCPALPIDETQKIIDLIKNGSCLYIYHPSLIPISQDILEKLP